VSNRAALDRASPVPRAAVSLNKSRGVSQ
jgi:hypothetical protein